MNAQKPSHPGIHPDSKVMGRLAQEIDKAKPSLPVGAFSKPLPGGTSLVMDRRRGGKCSVNHPWKLKVTGRGTGTVTVTVLGGTINAGTADDDDLIVTDSGLVSIYALATGTLSDSEDYVIGGTVTGVTLHSTTEALPAATSGSGAFTAPLLLGLVSDGKVSSQARFTSMSLAILNGGSPPDGTAGFLFGRA